MTQIGQSDKKNLSFGETFFCTGNGNPDKSCSQSSREDDVDDHNSVSDGVDDDHDGVILGIVCNGATSPLFHHVSRINAGLSALPISQPPPQGLYPLEDW